MLEADRCIHCGMPAREHSPQPHILGMCMLPEGKTYYARSTKVRQIDFTVECKAAPQGSMSGIAITRPDGSLSTILKADNPRTHPYRDQVGWAALRARSKAGINEVFAAAHVPVRVSITFVFEKPKSAEASRWLPAYKPDLDKLTRSTMDGMTKILYADDDQVCSAEQNKIYGTPECVHVSVQLMEQ